MGEVGRPLRPIAPRTMPPGGPGGLPPHGGNGGGPPDDGRMRRASTACKECQRRRTRCSGESPCSECLAHDRECIVDETTDKRRKASQRRTLEELNNVREFLDQLLAVFRSSDTGTVQQLVNIIRAGASQDELRSAVQTLHAQNPENPDFLRRSGPSHPHLDNNDPGHMGNYFDPQ
ncbi:hypothetical protein N7462_010546 [Penicillium macrosclerotiorum]|uniref:uncharacterized protein n=1 Tax=Penicillium macrosclerotiorum TaxID=303699 RepID=UPI002548FA92|nr:uncharacterized protein N7462_010546 [Penicillium macrosclerotiorum]KAJ5669476.1 hypothetical protein N7462_010546 [Penicillium macrosclerotiorum]